MREFFTTVRDTLLALDSPEHKADAVPEGETKDTSCSDGTAGPAPAPAAVAASLGAEAGTKAVPASGEATGSSTGASTPFKRHVAALIEHKRQVSSLCIRLRGLCLQHLQLFYGPAGGR
jgi:hypothetical protein